MWIQKITLRNHPVSIVQDELEREHARWPACASSKTVLDTMFHLTEIVEEKIANMMDKSPGGQVLYDAWTKNGTHFLGIYCSFMKPVYGIVCKKKEITCWVHECRLLVVSPMPALVGDNVDGDDETNQEAKDEAVKFDAEHHVNHLRETFLYYNKTVDEFVRCQCADSAAVNIKVARMLGIPHISCKNHCLSLESNRMVENDADLRDVTRRVLELAAVVRASAKASTALRNVAAKPGQHSSVRSKSRSITRQWVGEESALNAHIKLKDHFAKLIADKVVKNLGEHQDTLENSFIAKAEMHHKYLKEIKTVSLEMQKSKLSLSECQGNLDILMALVQRKKNRSKSLFYKCKLGTKKIVPDNGLSSEPDFETGIAKVQESVQSKNEMTADEIEACRAFLKLEFVIEEDSSNSDNETNIKQMMANRKKRKASEITGISKYIESDFVMGSAAVVEQLWSKADCIYTKRRAGLSPLVFEMIMFLKENRDLWNLFDVAEADNRRKDANKESRAEKRRAAQKDIEELVTNMTKEDEKKK